MESLENKSILITGSTGFLAKIFVEKVLRIQPNVKKLYLVVRAEDIKSAKQRLHDEVIGKDLFRVLKEKYGTNFNSFISNKVTPVVGDISCENLGVKDSDLKEQLWKEVDIIVNIAATVNFDERYDVALGINTMGAKHVLDFAKNCVKHEMLLHVSTAYVCGEKSGLILEKPFKMGETLNGILGLDIQTELKLAKEKRNELQAKQATKEEESTAMKEYGMQRARFYGWPNTYSFTKAMGEMLLGDLRENVPLAIIRPTIITSTYKEPFPGWVEGVRTIDSLAVGYGKGKLTCFLGDYDLILDLIPGDMVVNAMIAAMVTHANQPNEFVYQVGSSLGNPIKCTTFRDLAYRYFSKNPWIDKDGKRVIVTRPILFTTAASFQRYMAVRYLLPLKGLQVVNAALCNYFRHTYSSTNRKIKFVLRLVELYMPYIFFKGIFDDANLQKLRTTVTKPSEANQYYFDPKIIDWEDYFMNVHFPGIVRYVFK
ncbi:Fatty acyl-coa reductase [Thalictrum thalictroides]|uniref:Fatty acyl-CoA reductase n=1 Tax=Thalictrum thalictroides TaxID=46969 RepID=A0A7J6W7N9_THATH|nr:Fatty acyl-coa reductase [Thalictrum thalictroides]